jgi:hypothetical protein
VGEVKPRSDTAFSRPGLNSVSRHRAASHIGTSEVVLTASRKRRAECRTASYVSTKCQSVEPSSWFRGRNVDFLSFTRGRRKKRESGEPQFALALQGSAQGKKLAELLGLPTDGRLGIPWTAVHQPQAHLPSDQHARIFATYSSVCADPRRMQLVVPIG